MLTAVIESTYPVSFRKEDTNTLREHLRRRHSVDLIGMKRVGISNFLRFFLYHQDVKKTLAGTDENHLFIPVDLNDLIEREIYAFWMLTFKRVLDTVEDTALPQEIKRRISSAFLSSIQTQDLFLLLDGLRRSMGILVQASILPTIFFLRFDRIKDTVTPEFVDNLQGLRDATHEKLSYVFTSYRSLDSLSPQAFTKARLSTSSQVMYICPLKDEDMKIIMQEYKKRYSLSLSQDLENHLLGLVGGNVQYMQVALVILGEQKGVKSFNKNYIEQIIRQDERVILLGEELWESLSRMEKDVFIKIEKNEPLTAQDRKNASYIFETGMVREDGDALKGFNPLFSEYIQSVLKHVSQGKDLVFSKKEYLLFKLLENHTGEICERDLIIESVWPEYVEFGVSDWSIDRLVARVRGKLRKQASPFEIRTIRTRGYMLTERS